MIKYCIVTALTRVVVFSLLIGKKKKRQYSTIKFHGANDSSLILNLTEHHLKSKLGGFFSLRFLFQEMCRLYAY